MCSGVPSTLGVKPGIHSFKVAIYWISFVGEGVVGGSEGGGAAGGKLSI